MLGFLISTLRQFHRLPAHAERDAQARLQWCRDPLSHPVLDGMSERELGDLPFRR